MNITDIARNVFYCGVNDRVTDKFEGLWPLPQGVSYNSYIVKGKDKIALIDTVRIDEVREFLDHVHAISGSATIDYLIINHMEPDHSGSIPVVLAEFPDIRIVGNAQTVSMVKGFYGITDDSRYCLIKDGDTIDLGERELRFYLTPMVHWPETMMCYVPDVRLLFSGDAFGCFGALCGGVTDSEMDSDRYIPEMYRYYSNIVGKYGKFVEKAIAKLADIELDYICPTHGPVWHERISEVMDIYGNLAAYRPEKGVTIIYGSMYGNTAEVAEIISCRLAQRGMRNIRVHSATHSSMSEMISDAFRYEGLVVGSATYSMRLMPPVEAFMSAMETREVKNKVFAAFGSYTWAKGAALGALREYAERMKMPVVASLTMQQSITDAFRAEAEALADAVYDALTLK